MNFKSFDDLNRDILNNFHKIPKDVDVVVGIPRSGMLVASLIALYLNTLLADLNSFLNGSIMESGSTRRPINYNKRRNNPKKILVVEDSVHSGKSINRARKLIQEKNLGVEVIYFAAYVANGKEKLVDIYLDICKIPRVFEWNLMHHSVVKNTFFDLDGVLCVGPKPGQDDDGEKYKQVIANAQPLFVPTNKINTIVTCRLEKYREETENWLKKNYIKYGKLIMMQYDTKQERVRDGKYGEYKAYHYKNSNASLFIESNLRQAVLISKLSQKPVYCVQESRMIYPDAN